MRPLERIDRIIELVRSLVHKYPEKSFGEVIESAFTLLEKKFMREYIRGNLTRMGYIQDLVSDVTDKEVDEEVKKVKYLINKVLENVKEREKRQTRVHPMLVEDDVFEELLKFMVNSPNSKDFDKNNSEFSVRHGSLMTNVKDQICDLLLKIWKDVEPDWRFGQMLGNTCFDRLFSPIKEIDFPNINPIYWLLFDIPDDKVLEILQIYVSSGFKYSKKLSKLKLDMYLELIKNKEWTEKYNKIIQIDNYVQDMVKEYEISLND
jgi:hypothetical protein